MIGVIGVIADDYTGATDVAAAFRRTGLRTLLFFGPPEPTGELPAHDAIVVALKSRTILAERAVTLSLQSLARLREWGATRTYFKFCSTFDSSPRGNIGPVLDALADALDAQSVLLTPSSPEHGRTQYQGYLFVGDVLLAESPMRDHPVTPMTDSHLPRLLRAQTAHQVATIPLGTVRKGESAIEAASAAARYLLTDAITDDDLRTVGQVAAAMPLAAGAAGLAGGIAHAIASESTRDTEDVADPVGQGPAVVLSGSCSARTLEQLAELRRIGRPDYYLDVLAEPDPVRLADGALSWYDGLPPGARPVIYSSVPAAQLRQVQLALGAERAAAALELAAGLIAMGLVARGVRRIVVAGGETSGAVVTALGITGGLIGPEAARGVPWIYPIGENHALLLKSGNFGGPELLATASA